jgi:ComF family protein
MSRADDTSPEEQTAPPRRLSSVLARLGAPVVDFLLPPVCVACSARVASRDSLCPSCWNQISFIQPPLCDRLGIPLPYDTGTRTISTRALAEPPIYGRARAVAEFGGAMRDLIHRFKYADQHHPRRLFGRWMAVAGRELLADADVLVPIPLHRWRLARRRFNQAAELAREVARLTGVPSNPGLLQRIKRTPTQVGMTADQRRRNMQAAFAVPGTTADVFGLNIVLVDDVITTGATVDAAARVLLAAGATRVDVLALALVTDRVDPPRNAAVRGS